MKKGILRVLGVFVSLALMLTALPASMVMAAPTINVQNIEGTTTTNPYYGEAAGKIGDTIRISGTGDAGTSLHICISPQDAKIDDYIDDEVTTYKWLADPDIAIGLVNNYSVDVEVPDRLTDGSDDIAAGDMYGGLYYIYITVGSPESTTVKKIVAKTTFYVEGIAMGTMDETEGPVGTQTEIECQGFKPGEELEVYFEGEDITDDYVVEGDLETDEDGELVIVVEIPADEYGEHDIVVKGAESQAEVTFTFFIEPSITLTPASGQAGTTVTVEGTGFDRRNYVNIYIGNTFIIKTGLTNSTGSFSQQITIPASLTTGNYNIIAEDEDDDDIAAQATFTVALNSVITLSKNTGNVGDTVTVSGANFSPNATLSILFDSIVVSSATITDASGNFSATITIPAAVSGAHAIKVGAVQQTFTVTSKMVLDKTQGIAGTTVTITGTGFAGSTSIVATFNNAALTLNSSVTDASGGFTSTFTVPAVAAGTYEVKVIAGSTQTANFTVVDPTISLDKNSGKVGESITITGTNFAVGSTITFTIDGEANPNLPPTTANANGGFTVSFNIPAIAGGAHTLAVTSGVISKSAQFTVTASASIAPTSGNVGTSVTVTGTGFSASTAVTIKYNSSIVASGTITDAKGSFSAIFQVPASAGGAHTVDVTGGTNTIQLTFTMETTAPPSPTLTLPENASKQKEIITFDWSDVTDASLPVTYTLQIATDSSFTNIVLNVASLTASTYTLTEGQELAKLADNGSYYWRVKATDAAGNSSYSNTSTFTVGGSMPGWLMWVWIGIGVVVVFIFAIWLGRRLAYSSY